MTKHRQVTSYKFQVTAAAARNMIIAGICIFILAGFGACGKKKADSAAAKDWLVIHAADIKNVEGDVNGLFTVEYAESPEGPFYLVKGKVEDDLDLKIVKEGLEKLNPPLELKYSFEK